MKRSFRHYYKYLLRYKFSFFGAVIAHAISVLCLNVSNLFYKFFFDELDKNSTGNIFELLVALVLILAARELLNNLSYFLGDIALANGGRDARLDIFEHLHNLDFSFHADKKTGGIISVMKRGDGAFWSMHHEFNRGLLKVAIDFGFVAGLLASLNLTLSIMLAIVVILQIVVTSFLLKTNLKTRERFNEEDDNLFAIIVDNIINFVTVKFFAKEVQEKRRLEKEYKKWSDTLWTHLYTYRYIDLTTAFFAIGGTFLLVYYSLQLLKGENLTIGNFILVFIFTSTFFPKVSDLVYKLREITIKYTDLHAYFNLLDLEIEVKEDLNAANLKAEEGKIEFEDVDFNYKGRHRVIEDFTLRVKPHENIALVGKSGAGKTTITKLLFRFYDVNEGVIKIDGQDISKVTKKSLRRAIGIVPQDPILFNDTIGYNIGYALDKFDLEKVKKAARLANLDKFIERLPEKYDTLVGERGIKLSGGQRQRLAIARTILADPPIIIFDEATSQLDSESEKLIQEAFWRIAKEKTTIIIAHRLSTVMRANRIIVMNHGRIIEEGTHQELIKSNGIYKSLWNLQTGAMVESL